MNSDLSTGVSRRNFMRILGAASAAATSLPAFAAISPQAARRSAAAGADMGESSARSADTVIISSNENPLDLLRERSAILYHGRDWRSLSPRRDRKNDNGLQRDLLA